MMMNIVGFRSSRCSKRIVVTSRMKTPILTHCNHRTLVHVSYPVSNSTPLITLQPSLFRKHQICVNRLPPGDNKTDRCCKFFSTNSSVNSFNASEMRVQGSIDTIPDDIAEIVQHYAKKKQTQISLQQIMKTGQGELLGKSYKAEFQGRLGQRLASERILMQVASFLRHELPIRLAHRIEDLDQVPMMREMPSVQAVKAIYINSMLELIDFEEHITSPSLEEKFAALLETLYHNHGDVLMQMAQGAYELRHQVRLGNVKGRTTREGVVEAFSKMDECHKFLDRFYHSRVGIRVIAGQYLALRDQKTRGTMTMSTGQKQHHQDPSLPSSERRYVGMICLDTSPFEIVRHAAEDATELCLKKYGHAPEVVITGRLDLTFPYFPTHLHYMLLELLKNALRATMDHHYKNEDSELPPVTVIIADGTENEDVVIKIVDEGGGIPRSQVDNIWSYLFTTADSNVQETMIAGGDGHVQPAAPMAGLGFGLPMSRAYARYFRGELDVISMEGYGTDAFLYLARLGDKEPLPV